MTKTIDTLVKDIYDLFTEEFTPSESRINAFGQRLANHISTRVGERRNGNHLRLSNIGTPCNRKLWFSIQHSDKAEPLRPEVRLKFLIGDILEELLLFLAEEAGHRVEGAQDELEISGVKGHRDAVIDGVTVDTKSASSISFQKFEKGLTREEDDFGYIDQLHSYKWAGRNSPTKSSSEEAAFLVIDKTLGKICLDKHPDNGVSYDQVVEEKKAIVAQPEPPPIPFDPVPDGKSGNMKLPVICSYCQFKHPCWGNLRTFLYSNGPRYLTHVAREPDVIEIDKDGNFLERKI